MRERPTEKIEDGRFTKGRLASTPAEKCNGAFCVIAPTGIELTIIASDGEIGGWEHVSVSTRHRCPNWTEMSWVKDQFWNEEECVVEYHPPRSEYVNYHPFCLHLWRPLGVEIPLPPKILVGPKG